MDIGIIWVVVAICALFSALLMAGKGASIVTGFSASAPWEKPKYYEKKLCRTIGIGLGFITLVLATALVIAQTGLWPDIFSSWPVPALILLTLIVLFILANTVCRRKER